ncbi:MULTISPECIES: hypothetical protein [unclassified Fusibacter]|uniref:hypothetical protein n=1 Tax=unclassified Fusibacter TaxID=2624464 RepID=UPI0010137BFA|nr:MULTISPECIES: hypothetical protein [unclassified Fusibacter]MCK8061567.1 hypothetical protein [Fusibacter sp. A2]NPE23705.1 hypothetical protein [Fusibacter sp. A1]
MVDFGKFFGTGKKEEITTVMVSEFYIIGGYECFIDKVQIKRNELQVSIYSNNDLFLVNEDEMKTGLGPKIELLGLQKITVTINDTLYKRDVNRLDNVCHKVMQRTFQPLESVPELMKLKENGKINWESAGKQILVYRLPREFIDLKRMVFHLQYETDFIEIKPSRLRDRINTPLDKVVNLGSDKLILRSIHTEALTLQPEVVETMKASEELQTKRAVEVIEKYDKIEFVLEVPVVCEMVYILFDDARLDMVFSSLSRMQSIPPLYEGNKIIVIDKGMIEKGKSEVTYEIRFVTMKHPMEKEIEIIGAQKISR